MLAASASEARDLREGGAARDRGPIPAFLSAGNIHQVDRGQCGLWRFGNAIRAVNPP